MKYISLPFLPPIQNRANEKQTVRKIQSIKEKTCDFVPKTR